MKTRLRLEIIRFMNSNPKWRAILMAPPYYLKIRDLNGYIILSYNQIFSDFNERMVREARGLIVKKIGRKYVPVCIPFTKFFCVGDVNAKKSLNKLYHRKKWYMTEKIDGSIIKLWYDDDEWHISTNGTIDANIAEVQSYEEELTFKELFEKASKNKIDYNRLDKHYTYMFELVSLANKVVVPYEEDDIYYLSRRNNYTLYEIPYFEDDCIGVEKCKRPQCKVINVNKKPDKLIKELQKETNKLTKDDKNFEGYVISDKYLKTRVKMKSSQYMELFHKKGNSNLTPRKILLMILEHNDDDFISAFPEMKPRFDKVRLALSNLISHINNDITYIKTHKWNTQKEFAEYAKSTTCSTVSFKAYKCDNVDYDWVEHEIKNMRINTLLKILGFKEEEDVK